jgi:murein DD-endopeptidase MepM/ murein hydrolase activator NlpD
MSKRKIILTTLLLMFILGFLIPEHFTMPVAGADQNSYNSQSFWFYPWGRSGTHKGVDIFANKGTQVNSSTSGLVVYTGDVKTGGKV